MDLASPAETQLGVVPRDAAQPPVTVVLCTHNRPEDAMRCLQALNEQVTRHGWELIVVDSASSPENAAHLAEVCRSFSAVALLRLDEPGLSHARNRGAAVASGEWLIYIDDDAIPQPEWSASLSRALESANPATAVIGGRIEPSWPAGHEQAVRIITKRWLLLLSCVEDDAMGHVSEGSNICGANLAVHKRALLAIGGFPSHLGRVGNKLISGEESYVVERFRRDGLNALYDPSFAVWHRIDAERLTTQWVARRAYWEGVTRVQIYRALNEELPAFMNPIKLLGTIPLLWFMRWIFHSNPDYLIRLQLAHGSLRALLAREQLAH